MNSFRIRLRTPAGFSLLEVVIASAASTVLVAGLASVIYIAGETLDVESGSLAKANEVNQVIAQINHDLHSALTISELTSTAVTMTVPDRDGDNVPETIRYYWSGIGDSNLQYTYNGATTNLAKKVESFSLAWVTRLIEGTTSLPIILFVSGQAADGDGGLSTPSAAEQDRIDLMEGWGYDVTVISQAATQAEIDTQLAEATVVYASGECNAGTLSNKLNDAAIGVVTESHAHAEILGFYSGLSASTGSQATIEVKNNTHYITENFTLGQLTTATTNVTIKWSNSTLAPDAAIIAEFSSGLPFPTLIILDAGDELADSSAAAGRRCQLPWGESGFDVTTLNTDGLTIMQRALEWGAGAGDDTETPESGIEYHEFTEQQAGSSTSSITITTPPGTVEGDLLIAAVAIDSDPGSPSGSGWNTISVGTDGDQRMTFGVFWRIATASEPSSHTFNWSDSRRAFGWIMRFTGHNPANPIHDDATDTGRSSSPTAASVTTTVDECMIVRVGGFDDDDVTNGDAEVSGHTTIVANESSSGSSSCSGAAAYVMQPAAGSSGTASFSLSGSEEFRTVTVAIEPNPSP